MLKEISRASVGLAGILSVAAIITAKLYVPSLSSAAACTDTTSPYQCNTTFQVNVKESLAVSITTPSSGEWATGDVGDFLRNTVSLSVSSNNSAGFTASMYANTSATDHTSLVNQSKNTEILETLTGATTRSAFPSDRWGYSLDATTTLNNKTYNEVDAGYASSNYYPLTTSSAPISVLTGTGTGTRKIYFGAKASTATAAGTYAGTVVINVVTGTVNDGNTTAPDVPSNPAVASDDTANDSYATYSNGRTVYTTTSSTSTTSTTSVQVSDGDVTSSYQPVQGVTTRNADVNVSSDSSLTTGLAVTAAVAAASGVIFFILAKRKDDDDEEEEPQA